MIGLKTDIQRFEIAQCAHEQSGADQHKNAQPDLDRDRNPPKTQRAAAGCHHLLLQSRSQVRPPELGCGRETENQTHEQGERKIEKQYPQIRMRGKW